MAAEFIQSVDLTDAERKLLVSLLCFVRLGNEGAQNVAYNLLEKLDVFTEEAIQVLTEQVCFTVDNDGLTIEVDKLVL